METKEFNNTNKLKVQAILDLVGKYPTYCDENNRPHIFIENTDFLVESKAFKDELYSICFDNDLDVKPNLIIIACKILYSKISKNNDKLNLDYRIFKDENDNFLYQLNKKEMVVISDNKYEIQPITKPYFKSSNTFVEQYKPSKKPNMNKWLDCLNVDENERFLLQVLIILFFIPDIPKISLVFTGETGTGKSTTTDYIKELVDPSNARKISISKKELENRLSNHYLICFDNVGNITKEQSDIICRAITGDAYEKNTLDASYIVSYIRPIIINGIKCPIYKEDIIDRFIIFEFSKIDTTYVERLLLDKKAKKELPDALAYIFDVISRARVIKKDLKIGKNYRMADSYSWGYAIAEAIEFGGGKKFDRLIKEKLSEQNKMIIANNHTALAFVEYFRSILFYMGDTKKYTMTELYNHLSFTAKKIGCDKYFPQVASRLGVELRQLTKVLEREGFIVEFDHKTKANYVYITRKVIEE